MTAAAIEAAMRADEFLDQGNIDGRRVWHPSGSRRPGRHDLVVNDAGLEVGATVSPPWSAAYGIHTSCCGVTRG